MLMFIIFCSGLMISNGALILDNYEDICNFSVSEGDDFISVINKDWRVPIQNIEIIFNLCHNVTSSNEICGPHQACIKNKTDITYLDGQFNLDGKRLVLQSSIKLSIISDCSLSVEEEPKGRMLSNFEYEVALVSLDNCPDRCGTIVSYRLVNFTDIKGKYVVHSKNKTFSVSLCQPNPDCSNLASSCDITHKNKTLPISAGNEVISYNNKFAFKRKSKFPNGEKQFELFLKCDWLSQIPTLKYIEPQIQGKTYKFEMESSYGCVKFPPECEFSDTKYKYNLKEAYNPDGYWEVEKVPGHKKIFLNICGSMQLSQNEDNCSKSYSQVCQVNGDQYINKGSIYHNREVSSECISMTIITGATCHNDTSRKYSTIIQLYCSKNMEKPRFVKDENCDLLLFWNTPAACPYLIKESCDDNVSNVCTYKFQDDIYNLNNLHNTSGQVFIDNVNKSIEYHFNICGPIKDEYSSCKPTAVVTVHNLEEVNIRKRIKSFGYFSRFYVQDKYLVMDTDGGDFCTEQNIDSKSSIFFECTEKEVGISLKSRTDCKLEFWWKTPNACPRTSNKNCIFNSSFGDSYMLDFTETKTTSLRANITGRVYLFDLCGSNSSSCSDKGCTYVPANKTLITYGNKTHLVFNINQECNHKTPFNKTILELVCDRIQENEHFEFKHLTECSLIFQFKTHKVCFENFQEEIHIPLVEQSSEKIFHYKVDTIPAPSPKNSSAANTVPTTKVLTNCSITNPNTGYQFNISLLNLNVSALKCPRIAFNVESQIVTLEYDVQNSCISNDGERSKTDFKVMLKCKKDHLSNFTQKQGCSQTMTFEVPEACSLLDQHIIKSTSSSTRLGWGAFAAISVFVILVLLMMVASILLIYKRYKSNRSSYNSLRLPYEKSIIIERASETDTKALKSKLC